MKKRVAILVIALALCLPARGADELGKQLNAVLSLWEYPHDEYVKLVTLDSARISLLKSLLEQGSDARTKKAAMLLLALNCVSLPEDKTIYFQLERYRCGKQSFRMFTEFALRSLDHMYSLAFVTAEHREETIRFLKGYVEFWKRVSRENPKLSLGESDIEYIREITGFLENGGV